MPRSPRIQYPNALYHVMNRGRNKDIIFHANSDFQLFLDIISEANRKFNVTVHCYCLMSNHYHLLLETPEANLSQIMRFVAGNYVTIYNKRKGLDGSLFKSRYKAILIEKDTYLAELNRYIHRNPIDLVENLRDYKWSSYPAYLNLRKTPAWLNKSKSLGMLGCAHKLENYIRFVESHKEEEIYAKRNNVPSILGGRDFRKSFKS